MQTSISKEDIKDLPLKQFEGRITVVEDPEKVREVVEKLKQQNKIIGFDTETKPAFKKGVSHQVALLQLSTEEEAFLFRLNLTGIKGALTDLLSDSEILKVGVGIRDDLRGLRELNSFTPAGFVELQDVAPDYGIDVLSLKNLAGLLLGIRISKRQRLSNWEAVQLTEGQISYAATDAWVALQIYNKLTSMEPVPNKNETKQSPEQSS
ncbi:MAG: 3'-5' exonuclease [Marinilabiliaceae bacterium]